MSRQSDRGACVNKLVRVSETAIDATSHSQEARRRVCGWRPVLKSVHLAASHSCHKVAKFHSHPCAYGGRGQTPPSPTRASQPAPEPWNVGRGPSEVHRVCLSPPGSRASVHGCSSHMRACRAGPGQRPLGPGAGVTSTTARARRPTVRLVLEMDADRPVGRRSTSHSSSCNCRQTCVFTDATRTRLPTDPAGERPHGCGVARILFATCPGPAPRG